MGVATRSEAPPLSGVREPLLRLRHTTEMALLEDHHHYGLDRVRPLEYFWGCDAWVHCVCRYLDSLHKKGDKVVYVDVCGRASGHFVGADKSYGFSLQPVDFHIFRPEDDIAVQGDLFRLRDFSRFINLLRNRGDQPALVTFVPVVGLQAYTPEPRSLTEKVVYQRLLNNLRRMFEILRPGGFIYFERPFQLTEIWNTKPYQEWGITLEIKKFCEKYNCNLDIVQYQTGPSFLLRKAWGKSKRASIQSGARKK